jgi:tryptophan-rich sensory protein
MTILTTILLVIWGIYIINALTKKNWNDFFYGVCFLWVCIIDIPLTMEICIIILLIMVHKFIEKKEKEN